jgi:hypothetical protein
MGVLYVTGDAADTLKEDFDAGPLFTAWGWRFEYCYDIADADITGLVEIIPLVMGLERGLFLPSGTMLVGLRTANDWEFTAGPDLSSSGVGLAFAFGKTHRVGALNVPISFAIVSNDEGLRYSITIGGNLQQ